MRLKEQFLKSVRLLKSQKYFLAIATALFFVFIIVGSMQPNLFLEQQESTINAIVSQIEGKPGWFVIGFIIFNNVRSTLLALVLGLLFGVYPLLSLAVNGYLLGAVANRAGGTAEMVFSKVLPHGIFELPAFIIAHAMGLAIGYAVLKQRKEFVQRFKYALLVFVIVVVPLLIIAGVIEGLLYLHYSG